MFKDEQPTHRTLSPDARVEHAAAQAEATSMAELRTALRAEVGAQRYDVWFRRTTRWALDGDRLTLTVPDPFYRDWLRRHFREQVESVAAEVLGHPTSVVFRVETAAPLGAAPFSGDAQAEPNSGRQANRSPTTHQPPAASQPDTVALERSAEAQTPRIRKPRRCTLENLVCGHSNRLARTSATMALNELGQVNPLVLHGPPGVGKTHLTEAICFVARARQRLNAVYLTAEQFTTLFLEALNGKGLPSFRHKYRTVDLLAIDDVQFFVGKRATLVEMLATLDTLLRRGRQIVLTCDTPPAELSGLGSDLQGKLAAGLVCRIDSPELETRLGILHQLCRERGLTLDDEVLQLVASRVAGTARELSGAVCRLQATSLATGQPIGRELAETTLVELVAETGRAVRLVDIERAVCDVCGIEPEALHSGRRTRQVSYPRMIAMFLARKHTRAALGEIGQFFGRRSHSTVISAGKRVEAWRRERQTLQLAERELGVDDLLRRVENRLRTG